MRTRAVVAVLVAFAALLTACGDDDADGAAATEIRLEPISATFDGDFAGNLDAQRPTASLDIALAGSPSLGSAVGAALAGLLAPGSEPGLYGGSRSIGTCDVDALVGFLTDPANAGKAEAWAGVHGIEVDEIPDFVDGLTPVRLRFDTHVTNHGFTDGAATALQSVLEAGTAVLVDDLGVPRVKCNCGNPLLPPAAGGADDAAEPVGEAWDGFDPEAVAVVEPAEEAVDALVLVDVEDGLLFERPVGTDGEADRPVVGRDDLCASFAESPTCTGGGSPEAAMPDVTGADVAAARAALEGAGFTGRVTEVVEPSDLPAGTVVGTEPPAGRVVPIKSPVVLLVSAGPPEPTTTTAPPTTAPSTTTTEPETTTTSTERGVAVPNVVGLPRQQAQTTVGRAGLVPEVAFVTGGANDPPDTVVAQDPPPGTTVPEGTVVVLQVASQPID